jgi:hypothetical protein
MGWSNKLKLHRIASVEALRHVLSRLTISARKPRCFYASTKTALAVVLGSVILTACEDVQAIWVRSGSTASHLVFYIGRERGQREPIGFGGLTVRRCSSDESGVIMWGIQGIRGTQYADSVVYGIPNQRFEVSYPKHDLTPGCYTASIGGSGRVTFDVHSDNSVFDRASRDNP